ncbi:MAG: site-2 protease family protein [Eubacterium sp.]|nr:site-2 protease family protein [Eubacterium sp.]
MILEIWQKVYPILIAILFFELIILVHEGGHFVAARLMKIKVNEFSIGMGPKLIQFTKGDTKYSLRLILFGGYCSMEGESEESDDEASFSNKKVWQRMFVVVAGAFMNLILGFIIVAILTCSQELIGTPCVAKFDKNAVSSQTLRAGDVIKSIDGMRVYSPNDVTTGLSRSADDTLDMVVMRDGKEKKLSVKFNTEKIDSKQFIKMDFWLLGVKKTFPNIIKTTFSESVSIARMVFLSIHDLIFGRFGLSDLSGPVGAVSVVSTAVKTGVYSMLKIMALLTINIGLLNLFPLPALDGWRFFLLIFEGIFRKKLPDKWEWAINGAGLVILLGFMCVITFSDVTKLLR